MIIFDATPAMKRVSLTLNLDHAVALNGPELWALKGQSYSKINPTSTNSSGCSWKGISLPSGQKDLAFQLYWEAYDPMKPKWRYNANVEAVDQDDLPLAGAFGHVNPTSIPCDLADHRHFGQTGIYILWGV